MRLSLPSLRSWIIDAVPTVRPRCSQAMLRHEQETIVPSVSVMKMWLPVDCARVLMTIRRSQLESSPLRTSACAAWLTSSALETMLSRYSLMT